MNFDLSQDQQMMRETFARFLNEHSSMARVRAAMPSGFDHALWIGLAELGAFSLRVPESSGGLDLGVLDATILMEHGGGFAKTLRHMVRAAEKLCRELRYRGRPLNRGTRPRPAANARLIEGSARFRIDPD